MMNSYLPSTLVVLDIDHTLSDPTNRWKRLPNVVSYFRSCDQDEPVTAIIDAVRPLFDDKDVDVIFVTARPNDKVVVLRTKEWLGRFLPARPVFFKPILSLTRFHVYKDKRCSLIVNPIINRWSLSTTIQKFVGTLKKTDTKPSTLMKCTLQKT